MLEVWGRKNSNNVMAVMWAVAELGISHKRYDVGGTFGGLDSTEFLAMNPNGRIPVIRHEGNVLYESTTIIRFLATLYDHKKLWPDDIYQRALADQWMDWFKSTFYPAFHPMFWGLIRTPEGQQDHQKISTAVALTANVLSVVEQRLSGFPFLAGDQFSLGDIPLGACIYRYFNLDIERPALPAVTAWYQRLKGMPAYQQHVMIPFGRNHVEWLQLETGNNSRQQ